MKFNKDGLIPVITQDYITKEVLMLAYMNEEAFEKTKETGKVHYFSRSRNELWLKGETSGHYQLVKNIVKDCDEDALLIFVEQIGGACHTGHKSCFFTDIEGTTLGEKVFDDKEVYKNKQKHPLDVLSDTITERVENPKEGSYTNYLFDKGIDKILKKIGEEASEIIIASKNTNEKELVGEMADFMYHLSVLLSYKKLSFKDIYNELETRKS